MQREHKASRAQIAKYRQFARQLIEHHLGSPPSRLKFQSSGLSNFVFAAIHKDGRVFVRISPEPDKLNSFIKEQWAQSRAAGEGIPVGRILETAASAIPYPYMISEQV